MDNADHRSVASTTWSATSTQPSAAPETATSPPPAPALPTRVRPETTPAKNWPPSTARATDARICHPTSETSSSESAPRKPHGKQTAIAVASTVIAVPTASAASAASRSAIAKPPDRNPPPSVTYRAAERSIAHELTAAGRKFSACANVTPVADPRDNQGNVLIPGTTSARRPQSDPGCAGPSGRPCRARACDVPRLMSLTLPRSCRRRRSDQIAWCPPAQGSPVAVERTRSSTRALKGRPSLSGMQVAAAGLRWVHPLSPRTVSE